MCGRGRESAPGPLTLWPQLEAWLCNSPECRRHAQHEVLEGPAFEPLHARMRAAVALDTARKQQRS